MNAARILNRMKCLWLLLYLASPAMAFSSRPICFDITWESSPLPGAPTAKQLDGVQNFITINGQTAVGFVFDPSSFSVANEDHVTFSHSRGCTDAGNFEIGGNDLVMSFVLLGNQAINVGFLRVIVQLILPNGNSVMIGAQAFDANPNVTAWSFRKNYNASLAEIAPDIIAQSARMEADIQAQTQQIQALDQSFETDLQTYGRVFDDIKDKSFLEMSEQDMAGFQEAAARYMFLKQGIEAKQNQIAQKSAALKAETAAAKIQIETAIANEGLDIKAADLLDVNLNIPLDPLASAVQTGAAAYPYAVWADQTIQQLQYLLDSEQRAAFLEQALRWTVQTDRFLQLLQARRSLAKDEWNAFEASTNRVNTYLFGDGADKKGILTKDFWFADLGVDPSVRETIDGPLAARNPEGARRLKAEINALKTLTASIAAHLRAIAELADMYKAAASEPERSFLDKLVAGATAVIAEAPAIAECVTKSYVAGPYADFYEFFYETDFCTGQPNDAFAQALAGTSLGLAAGSALLSGPFGGWIVEQVEVPIQFLKRISSVFHGTVSAKIGGKIDGLRSIFVSGITTKIVHDAEGLKKLAKGFPALTVEEGEKILKGAINSKGRLIGVHSASVLKDGSFVLHDVVKNADGTISCKIEKLLSDGTRTRLKASTLFPESWSDEKVLDAVRMIAGGKPIAVRSRDGAKLFRDVIDGVEVIAIREGTKVTSGFPTGTIGYIVEGFIVL